MLNKYITSNNFLLLGCCCLAIGIPCDGFLRGLENAGVIALLVSAALNYKNFKRERLTSPINISLLLLFLLCVFGYLYTGNINELNRKTALKVLLVLFPLAFSLTPKITEAVKRISILVFIIATAFLALLTCADYFLHFKEYNLLIRQSKPIYIIGGTMHIYFSMMLAAGVFLGLHLLNVNFKIVITTVWDKIILATVIINIVALHVLTARTGLMAFYVALIILLLRYTIKTRRYKTLIGGLCAIIVFPMLMYFAVPSVKNRINNTYDDLHRYYSGDYVGYFSISGRFETWKVAMHIFEEHKLFGIGSGDLQQAIETQYAIDGTRLMREESLPNCHNQYIETLAAYGLTGIIVFGALLFSMGSLVKQLPRNNYLLLAFLTLFITAFLVESLLEREAGITLFLFFFFLIKNNAYDSEKNTSVAP